MTTEEILEPYDILIITGGSSGIGRAFLRAALSTKTPKSIANLSRSTAEFKEGIHRCQHFPVDLTDRDLLLQNFYKIREWIAASEGKRILLINNSGYGAYGAFPAGDLETELGMLDLNIRALVHLTGLLKPLLLEHGGAVMNIASIAGFLPAPFMSTYAATKSFVLHWGLALNQELMEGGQAFCLTVCPGPTESAFFERAGFKVSPLKGVGGHTAEQVVAMSLKALGKRKSLLICGWVNWLVIGMGSLLPKRWVAPVALKVIKSLRLSQFQ